MAMPYYVMYNMWINGIVDKKKEGERTMDAF